METDDEPADIPDKNENNLPESENFVEVFPINKDLNARSKKPLKRIPITFIDNVPEQERTSIKRTEDEALPEWMKSPKLMKSSHSGDSPESPKLSKTSDMETEDRLLDTRKRSSTDDAVQTNGRNFADKRAKTDKLESFGSFSDKKITDNTLQSPNKETSEETSKLDDSTESSLSESCDKDFKYIFPINKKPHQRSKVPLKRIPIKFV